MGLTDERHIIVAPAAEPFPRSAFFAENPRLAAFELLATVVAALALLVLILPGVLWLSRGAEHPQAHPARQPAGLRGMARADARPRPLRGRWF